MKKLMLLTGVLAFFIFSCNDPPSEDPPDFWAQNLSNEEFYGVYAELLYTGTRCNVWVEKGSASYEDAKKVANEYDTKIYQKMLDNFGVTLTDSEGSFTNIEAADFLGDDDGKLCILLLDIKDDYNGTTNLAYTAGYFWPNDLLRNHSRSNNRDMIYIDTNPGLSSKPKDTYATLAHEMQHMMNFATTIFVRSVINSQGQITSLNLMDTWIDEGLASAAEWVYLKDNTNDGHSNGRVSYYNNNPSKLIDRGNNFFVWGNRTNDYKNAVLDDYATVYLFFQWLRIHANNNTNNIYANIIGSKKSSYDAVTEEFNKLVSGYSDWSKLLETWLAANRIMNSATNSIYGYKNETTINTIKAPYAPITSGNPPTAITSFQLYPGEGVYSQATTNPNKTSSGNIQYSYLANSSVSSTWSSSGDLLTFNKNTALTATTESGDTTGAGTNINTNVQEISEGRYIQASNELIRLDAGDMLRRNGNVNRFISGNPLPDMTRRIR